MHNKNIPFWTCKHTGVASSDRNGDEHMGGKIKAVKIPLRSTATTLRELRKFSVSYPPPSVCVYVFPSIYLCIYLFIYIYLYVFEKTTFPMLSVTEVYPSVTPMYIVITRHPSFWLSPNAVFILRYNNEDFGRNP